MERHFPEFTNTRTRTTSRRVPKFSEISSKKGKVCIRANVAHQAGAYPGFRSMKRLGVFLLPPG